MTGIEMSCIGRREMPKKLFGIICCFPVAHTHLWAPPAARSWQEDPVWICLDIISLILLFTLCWSCAAKPEQPWGVLAAWCGACLRAPRAASAPTKASLGGSLGRVIARSRLCSGGSLAFLVSSYKAGAGWQRGGLSKYLA